MHEPSSGLQSWHEIRSWRIPAGMVKCYGHIADVAQWQSISLVMKRLWVRFPPSAPSIRDKKDVSNKSTEKSVLLSNISPLFIENIRHSEIGIFFEPLWQKDIIPLSGCILWSELLTFLHCPFSPQSEFSFRLGLFCVLSENIRILLI